MAWSTPDKDTLFDCVAATWPPARYVTAGGFEIGIGLGGGKRVSSAALINTDYRIDLAEAAMAQAGQQALFMLRDDQLQLDKQLEQQGYRVIDPVVLMAGDVDLFNPADGTNARFHDSPTEEQKRIWLAGGVGQGRWDIMQRPTGPHACAGISNVTGFVAIHNRIAMVHAVEVDRNHRRRGLGRTFMHALGPWARENGAKTLACVTTVENTAARGLYGAMGMVQVGNYHYRIKD